MSPPQGEKRRSKLNTDGCPAIIPAHKHIYVTYRNVYYSIFGRQFVKRSALYAIMGPLSVLSVSCNVGVLWPNGWMDQHATW